MKLNYKVFGQGKALVILHGLFGMLDNWQTIAKALADHFSVYIIDQRNHGRSPHTDQMDYKLMAEDLRHFLEEKWIFKTSILGHSMGGKVAMQFAHCYPDMVEKLVVVDMAPKAYPAGHNQIFAALLSLDLSQISTREEADELLREQGIPNFSVRQFLLKNLSRNKAGGYRWKMNLPIIHQFYPEILREIIGEEDFEKPSLFIRGGQSPYILDSDWENITALFPGALLETIPDSGHWVHAEAPEALKKRLLDFLC